MTNIDLTQFSAALSYVANKLTGGVIRLYFTTFVNLMNNKQLEFVVVRKGTTNFRRDQKEKSQILTAITFSNILIIKFTNNISLFCHESANTYEQPTTHKLRLTDTSTRLCKATSDTGNYFVDKSKTCRYSLSDLSYQLAQSHGKSVTGTVSVKGCSGSALDGRGSNFMPKKLIRH